ncbi:MAG: hypothetical protein ACE5WD_10925 [Candidatus Aminicenantia bacterium]
MKSLPNEKKLIRLFYLALLSLLLVERDFVFGLSLEELEKFDLSLQYRVMYNASNIPGSGGSTFTDLRNYDFFRQRFRLSLDVQPTKNIGGFAQVEFRGGWGVGPDISDPREGIREAVVFNRLKARGIRYGFLYAFLGKDQKLNAGIIPVSDKVGDTLFSSDWDFNVGGISLEGKIRGKKYRLAYLRLVDTLGTELDRNGEFYIFDFINPILGAHVYFMRKERHPDLPDFLGEEINEAWYALTSSFDLGKTKLNAFLMINNGKYKDISHTGIAFKGEGEFSFGTANLGLLCLYTTGDKEEIGKRTFLTPQGILGTGGYWAYTHIFTPQGPSDVNDFGLEIGNKGAGLFTSQMKLEIPLISERLDFKITGGLFYANKERNESKYMGVELGGEFTLFIDQYLTFDFGTSYVRLGGFYGKEIPRGIYEIFGRFQLEF